VSIPIHKAAASGFQRQAETYQRARPTYHPALIHRIVERWADGRVIELGAGTGIFTAQMLEAGVPMIAVEPVEAMREILKSNVGVEVLDGTAESIPLDDSSVDAVIAAQAFHWFDASLAIDEIARVLRPGGRLVTVWNVRNESVPWVAQVTEVLDRYAGDTPRHRTFEWRRAIDRDSRFTLIDDLSIENPVPTDESGVVDRSVSTSFIAALGLDDQREVKEEIIAIVGGLGPTFEYPYRSEMQVWRIA
jgi:SAM-dependent methyltransferase